MKNKLSILFVGVLGALVVLLAVVTYYNLHSGEKYKKQVLSQAQQKYENRTMPAKRGTIYDGMATFWQPATRCIMLYWTAKPLMKIRIISILR